MKRWGRTWIVFAPAADDPRTEEVDHKARSAEGGLSYRTGEDLPEYHGVWLAPNGGFYHVFSDYPMETHERFGWSRPAS